MDDCQLNIERMLKVGNQCSATSHETFKSKMVNHRGRFAATGYPYSAKTSLNRTLAIGSGESRTSDAELWSLGTNQLNLASLIVD